MIHRDEYWLKAEQAAGQLGQHGLYPADVAIQCGSGMAQLVDMLLPGAQRMDMDELPYLPAAAVTGHGKQVAHGTLGGNRVLVFTGRIHLYEGHTPEVAGLPAAIAKAAGAKLFIAINAAGALNQHFSPGSLMVHRDYLNFQGDSAMRYIKVEEMRERFLNPRPAYDMQAAAWLARACQQAGAQVHQGVYASVHGPVFETQAELAWLRSSGGDAVGMSTIPEVTICHFADLPVIAVSVITNSCFGDGKTSHQEVVAQAGKTVPILAAGLRGMLEEQTWRKEGQSE